jgi:regulator of protease activity HflC (stomatin/prohibitin superfamily)
MEALLGLIPCLIIIGIIILIILFSAVKVVKEYERAVIFRLGKYASPPRGPGLFFIIPFVDQLTKVDLRTITLDVPSQEAITRDNVTLKVNAVAYFRVLFPDKAIIQVEDYRRATWQIAQTTLRNVIGQSELDELLSHREKINEQLQQIIDEQTEPWGVKVSVVEVKDVELPQTMQRAMAMQAEAERQKRAKIIHASGEYEASKTLGEAGAVMSENPVTLQLRYLSTLSEIAAERNSTIIFPLPVDTIANFVKMLYDRDKTDSNE